MPRDTNEFTLLLAGDVNMATPGHDRTVLCKWEMDDAKPLEQRAAALEVN